MRKAVLAVLSFSLASCGVPPANSGTVHPDGLDRTFSSFDSQVDSLLERMTLEEKVGQMTQADHEFLADDSDVQKYFLGSILNGGNSDPETNSFEDWRAMYNRLQSQALETRLGIPLLYGVDAVHGHNNVLGAVVFPHNIGLGATRNPELVQEISRITALEVRATGINWTFAPCVSAVRDERWGRTYEGFSEEGEVARELGVAAVRGYQGTSLEDPRRVLACAKHFIGDGATTFGTGLVQGDRQFPMDRGDVRIDEEALRRIHLPAYIDAIEAGVGTIMPSFSSWNGVKSSASKRLLTDILKNELGFQGFLISDWAAIDEIPGDYRSDIKTSINAGMDMVMVPDKYAEFFTTLKSLVEDGEIPMSRIDDAVRRILRVKASMGLLDTDRNHLADPSLAPHFGSAEHREVARRAVRESLVLLQNRNGTLPLSKSPTRIHVAGRSADDLGRQSGGWTIEWQGHEGNENVGTTILEAIRLVAGPDAVTYSRDGTGAEGADVGIVVIGEGPYAEMMGDREDLSLSREDLESVANVKRAGIPTVVVLISGRPMILGEVLEQADALLAAWLPGSEGQGVADILFGDSAPTGKLSFSWPRSMEQIPINIGDEPYDPLFPFGFGLSF